MNNELKKIIVIGGGHGTGIVLASLASSQKYSLSAIVSMADDGGSTGKLRQELGVSAVGDIRQCLVRMSDSKEVAQLFSHRFEGGKLDGHTLGNLFLASGELMTGSIEGAVNMARKALGVNAAILPVTEDKPYLYLEIDGKTTKGVHTIATTDFDGRRANFYLEPEPSLSVVAEEALQKADLILIAPGNFYCSIMPALLTKGIAKVINSSKAKTVFITNLVNRPSQTIDYDTHDYIDEINRLTGGLSIDMVLYNTSDIPEGCLKEGERPVGVDIIKNVAYKCIGRDIADTEPVPVNTADKIAAVRSLVRHDKSKLAEVLSEIAEGI